MTIKTDTEGWASYLRFITPVGVSICIFFLTQILGNVHEINDRLFKHLTNDEMHCPKSVVVSKAEFLIYQEMRNKQMENLREDLNSRVSNLTKSIDKAIEALGNEKRNH